ncbi:MAG: acylneuraminate cytidylyltransferase [Spirochaetaceae bacterium]|nr:MAG: acylneuraminate cytidylyltransferase [Spirochaetaceae bacterium]
MTGILIQVRLGSTRLKQKALLPLGDRSVIEHAMLALRVVDADVFALLSDQPSAELLRPAAERCGYRLFAGHDTDVLQRYIDAAEQFGVRTIVRATGDNPVVSGPLAQALLERHRDNTAVLSGFDDLPLGCGVEIVERSALEQAHAASQDRYDREHVTAYLYRHRDRFTVGRYPADPEYCAPEVRVTLDSAEDYQLLCDLYALHYRGQPLAIEQVIQWWRSRTTTIGAAR